MKPKYFVVTGFEYKHQAVAFYKTKINKLQGACFGHYADKSDPSDSLDKLEKIEYRLHAFSCECSPNDDDLSWEPCLKCEMQEILYKKKG